MCAVLCGCAVKKTPEQSIEEKPFIGVWISCYELDRMLDSGNFESEFPSVCRKLGDFGVSDAFVHMRAFADSLFNSKYYAQKENTLAYGFDVPEFIINELKRCGIRTHAWINPFRTAPGTFSDPSDRKVCARVLGGIREIAENYDVAGIHFDDYFYPAGNDGIDEKSYEKYKKAAGDPLSKADWRRANISSLIFAVRDFLDGFYKKILFSVSPAADIEKNKNTYFADVETWCKEGAVDLIIPQLYFGFDYPDKKFGFDNLISGWKKLKRSENTKLVIGLAAYKLGTKEPPDSAEWQNGADILSRETEICLADGEISGVCFFSYSYLFSDKKLNTAARKKIEEILPS